MDSAVAVVAAVLLAYRNIWAAVCEELVTDPLIDADDIVVEVVGGAVSLTGTVPSQAQCAEAAAAAWRVAGVTTVDNMLTLALPSRDFGDDTAGSVGEPGPHGECRRAGRCQGDRS